MPEMTTYENGTPCWVDLGTPDLPAAIAFYSALFGWEVEVGEAQFGHYSNASLDGKVVAALADQQVPGMVVWTTYLAVDDVEATLAAVEPAGGSVVMPATDIPGVGRMAIVADPTGTVVSLWQAGEHRGAELVNEPGTLCWNELTTRDPEVALAFLEAVVGVTGTLIDMGTGPYYELHAASGRLIGGLMPMIGEMWPAEIPNHWMVYFAVSDTDAAAARVAELGGAVQVPPTDIPPGRFSVVSDPQGGHFSIIALNDLGAS